MSVEKMVSKVIYGGRTLIDLTGDTIKAAHLLKDYTAHGADGQPITGECTYDCDTSQGTADEDEILAGKRAYVRGVERIGKMPNRGAVTGTISDKDTDFEILQGFHDGSGKVGIDPTEKSKLIPSNIRKDVKILGVTGSMTGEEDVTAIAGEFTPTVSGDTVLPPEGYDYLTQVVVNPIPYNESENAAGGKTVAIA